MASDFQIRWKRHRQRLKVLQLDQYPSTPAGYYSGYYPGSKAQLSNKIRYKYALQKLPELNQYPLTPVDIIELVTQPTRKTKRTLRTTPELNQHPATPAAYYNGYFPGSKLAVGIKSKRKVKLQSVPELNRHPSAPVQAPVSSWETHFEKVKNQTNRKLLGVELNTYPQTPSGYYNGYYPGSMAVKSNRIKFDIKTQVLPLDEYTYSPIVYAALHSDYALKLRRTNFKSQVLIPVIEASLYVASPDNPARWDIILEIQPNYRAEVNLEPNYAIVELSSDPNFKADIDV